MPVVNIGDASGVSVSGFRERQRNRRYMNINVHFEDMFKSLGMARVHGSLPGEKCADLIMRRLEEYNIELYMVEWNYCFLILKVTLMNTNSF